MSKDLDELFSDKEDAIEMQHFKVTFNYQISENAPKNTVKMHIIHNLTDYGLDIEAGLQSWIFRTESFTEHDFVEYLRDKTPAATIFTKTQFDKFLEKQGYDTEEFHKQTSKFTEEILKDKANDNDNT